MYKKNNDNYHYIINGKLQNANFIYEKENNVISILFNYNIMWIKIFIIMWLKKYNGIILNNNNNNNIIEDVYLR